MSIFWSTSPFNLDLNDDHGMKVEFQITSIASVEMHVRGGEGEGEGELVSARRAKKRWTRDRVSASAQIWHRRPSYVSAAMVDGADGGVIYEARIMLPASASLFSCRVPRLTVL